MASISTDPNGRRRLLFADRNGRRKTIRLGDIPKRKAEAIKAHVENIVVSQLSQQPMEKETARWIGQIGDVLADKLARAGVIQPRASALLGDFVAGYVAGRTDLKPRTITKFAATKLYLTEFFGAEKPMREITVGDADDWRIHLISKRMVENTVRKHSQIAKQFFTAAVRKKLIDDNPFSGLPATVNGNSEKFHFVSLADAEKILASCPDAEWRLIFALSRFGGLRCPSEHLALTWNDVDWENGRILVRAPKTEHHEGKGTRLVPLFPELRPYLDDAFGQAPEGSLHVIRRYRDANANLRTQLLRIMRRAGVEPWPKLFQNLRSTRETELAECFPIHVVCAWIGNSNAVAAKHYLQVTDDHFRRAAQNPTQTAHATAVCGGQHRQETPPLSPMSEADKAGHSWTTVQVAEEGLEPPTRGL